MGSQALLDRRREEAAHPAEDSRALPEAETARDLLLDVGHPQVTLPLILGEGALGILEETQHVILVRLETFEQVARFGALGAPAFSR